MRKITGLIAILMMYGSLSGSTVMIIHRSDGTKERIPISEIQKVTFDLGGASLVSKNISMKKFGAVAARVNSSSKRIRVEFDITSPNHVNVAVWDARGRLVSVLLNEYRSTGHFSMEWDSSHLVKQGMRFGAYLIRVQSGSIVVFDKLLIM